jgi:hypothetical protein
MITLLAVIVSDGTYLDRDLSISCPAKLLQFLRDILHSSALASQLRNDKALLFRDITFEDLLAAS